MFYTLEITKFIYEKLVLFYDALVSHVLKKGLFTILAKIIATKILLKR